MNRRNAYNRNMDTYGAPDLTDHGPEPFVVNIRRAAARNGNFRMALWTGTHLQLTLMSIPVRGEIGLEAHPHVDQFLRVESGHGVVKMGGGPDDLDFQKNVFEGDAIFVPAGTWHNLVNTGNRPIRLYSVYAPPQHPHGAVQETKDIAEAEEHHY